MKLMLILLLLITSLMAVVGAFLTTSVSSFYIDTFYEQISAVFSDDSDGYVSTLRAGRPNGRRRRHQGDAGGPGRLTWASTTAPGTTSILDGQSGTYLDGSAEASELPRAQTRQPADRPECRGSGRQHPGGRPQRHHRRLYGRSHPHHGGRKRLHHLHPGQQGHSDGPETPRLFLIIMQALVIGPADLCPVELPAVQDHGGPHRKSSPPGQSGVAAVRL